MPSPLIFFVLTLGVLGVTGDDINFLTSCKPACPEGSIPGAKTPDPRDCKRYYLCMADGTPTDFTQDCPEGQLFDSNILDCAESSSATCAMCRPTCQFECPQGTPEAYAIADSTDCSIWHICVEGSVALNDVCDGDKPYFDGSGCTSDQSQCCNGCTTEPFCSLSYTEVSDPTNCSNFYFCDHVKYPDEGDLYSCESGYFDPNEGICSDLAPCQQLCGEHATGVPPRPITSTEAPSGTTTTIGVSSGTTTTTEGPTTTHPTIPSDCVEEFVCEEYGYFPKCTEHCDVHFYECQYDDLGTVVSADKCTVGRLLDPDLVVCVAPESCPYPSVP